jgi:hypothetical protein
MRGFLKMGGIPPFDGFQVAGGDAGAKELLPGACRMYG